MLMFYPICLKLLNALTQKIEWQYMQQVKSPVLMRLSCCLILHVISKSAMPNSILQFATKVANEFGHSPHYCPEAGLIKLYLSFLVLTLTKLKNANAL